MGYTTDFIGHVDIAPALNEAEIDYLEAFCASRRWERPGGPYEVPGNPPCGGAATRAGQRIQRSGAGPAGSVV